MLILEVITNIEGTLYVGGCLVWSVQGWEVDKEISVSLSLAVKGGGTQI